MWWDALKMKVLGLDQFIDMDMYLFIENAICQGVTVITHRFTKVNLPEIEVYDEKKLNNVKFT